MKNNRVILGFSGGVDSTAACLLLKEKGYDVHALFLDVLPEGNSGDAEEAEQRAAELGIPFTRLDVSSDFEKQVIGDFCRSYQNGETPNPCVICNPEIKFRFLFQTADEMGAAYVATGHYAKMEQQCIFRAASSEKDQSYMLWKLIGRYDFSRILFPLGEVPSKEWIRNYVKEKGLGNFEKKDSQDICFIPKTKHYLEFLEERGISSSNGVFIDSEGNQLAPSKGYLNYTIGQRKGFGVGFGKPMFVTSLDAKKNRITLGDEKLLFQREVHVKDLVLTKNYFGKPLRCYGKIRYRSVPAGCCLNGSVVTFEEPQRAPTPGQSLVFYIDDRLIGGAIIKE